MQPAMDLAFHGDPALLPAMARRVEERGTVGGLFVSEAVHDPFVALTLAAVNTTRLQIGTSIALAFARSPMSMAYSAYDLQRLSGGRLLLGLGSQIKPHIERRYDMPWSRPSARMREYVEALRAIWHAWQTGERLSFRGEFYSHTLMPPLFDPGPLGFDAPPVWLAGVGPRMVETAGAVADGFLAHPLVSRDYFADALVPQLAAGGESAGRDQGIEVCALAMVVTGRTEESLREAVAATRRQIGFYASTPAYRTVLDHHGWGELHELAHQCTVRSQWDRLESLVDDEVLHTFAVVGEIDRVGPAVRQRFAGLADRVMLSIPYPADDTLALDVASA